MSLSRTEPAFAGSANHIGAAAVTADGKYYAAFQELDGAIQVCGLTRQAPRATYDPPKGLIITAACVDDAGQLLPVGRWGWQRRVPELKNLRAFHRDQVSGAPVRIVRDRDTLVARLEVFERGTWFPAWTDESSGLTEVPLAKRYGSPETTIVGSWRGVTGFVRLDDAFLIRVSRYDGLSSWDEILRLSQPEVSNVGARFHAARQRAIDATKQLRLQRHDQSGVFVATPAGPVNQIVRKRNRAAAARAAIRLWEAAAAYGSFAASDVREALWLFAWVDVPTRRLEALRWYSGLRDRQPVEAESIVRELEADADTAWLGAHLRRAQDPLRGLPDVAGSILGDGDLVALSNDQLRWLHLAQWAAQGGYRFRASAVHDYFAQFPWYCPIPPPDWVRRQSKAFKLDPDAPLLRRDRPANPSSARKESLEAILRAEKLRGLNPPKEELAIVDRAESI